MMKDLISWKNNHEGAGLDWHYVYCKKKEKKKKGVPSNIPYILFLFFVNKDPQKKSLFSYSRSEHLRKKMVFKYLVFTWAGI